MALIISTIVAYLAVLFFCRKNILLQQLCFFFIYIVNVTVLKGLDIALPIYFLFSLLPFFSSIKKINRWGLFLMLYLGVYLVIGVLIQNPEETIVMFVSRCWQFPFFFIVFYSDKRINNKINYATLFRIAFTLETALAIYLYLTKRGLYEVVRLTAGAQPITGNISIIMLPIICYCFYKYKTVRSQNRTVIEALLFATFVCISGTRGYELVFFLTIIWIVWDYTLTISDKRHSMIRFLLLVTTTLGLTALLFIVPDYLQHALTILRLNKHSIGIRTFENNACIDFILNAPIVVKIFGVGMGGQLGSYQAFINAIDKQFTLGMWNQADYLNNSGALFHNLYANILCNLGIIGIAVILVSAINIWKIINSSVNDKKMRISFKIFFIGFLIMNDFRWSADCGIAIICVFALMVKGTAKDDSAYSSDLNCWHFNRKAGS